MTMHKSETLINTFIVLYCIKLLFIVQINEQKKTKKTTNITKTKIEKINRNLTNPVIQNYGFLCFIFSQ